MEVAYSECSTSDVIDEGSSTHGCKREYGDCDDGVDERRVRSRLAEQFVLLREAVPILQTQDERASILAGAYEYIERLQRQEAELLCELEEDVVDDSETSCCEDDVGVSCSSFRQVVAVDDERTVESDSGSCSTSVEVVSTEAGLRIHIECAMQPGLLLAVMELLESHNLSVEDASVECVERLIFNGIGLQDTDAETRVSAEVLEASLRLLLCRSAQQQEMNATVE